MQQTYIDTVRLLLDAAPEVFRGGVFAMKGGTAINLFVHDMPRLSVDIDLVYPDWSASRADALRAIGDELAAIADRLQRIGLSARTVRAEGLGESKLLVERVGRGGDALVKIEANLVFRGTVLPTTRRALSPVVSDMYSAEVSVPMLAVDELYGSKLVAAMDRQHPRDLFDVMRLYDAGIDGVRGVTDGMVECFVLYLAGHNRPMDEVLAPRVDIRPRPELRDVGRGDLAVAVPVGVGICGSVRRAAGGSSHAASRSAASRSARRLTADARLLPLLAAASSYAETIRKCHFSHMTWRRPRRDCAGRR
jgi:predicted nucleotidyltransferase component of viral defense system